MIHNLNGKGKKGRNLGRSLSKPDFGRRFQKNGAYLSGRRLHTGIVGDKERVVPPVYV